MERVKKIIYSAIVAIITASMIVSQPQLLFAAGEQTLTVNSKDAVLKTAGSFSGSVEVAYGDSVTLGVSNYTGTVSYKYVPSTTTIDDSTVWTDWGTTGPTKPGNYYVGYDLTIDGGLVSTYNNTQGFTIVKAALGKPADLSWSNGSKATWSAVSKTASGVSLDSGTNVSYNVTLYKDATKVDTYTTTETSKDFTSIIQAQGKGKYTYTLSATTTNNTDLYKSSDSSDASAGTYAVSTSLAKGTGIASVTPDTSTLLITGNSDHNTLAVEATVKDGYTFEKWSASQENATFTSATSTSTTFKLGDSYTGSTSLTLTASTKDDIAPTLTSFSAGTGSDYGKLSVKGTDAGSGVSAFAITTESDQTKLSDSDWHADTSSYTMSVSAAGTYYAYVKDASGNITKSSNSIKAETVTYHDFYKEGVKTDKVAYVVGDTALTLDNSAVRSGYAFGGWYTSSGLTGDAVTTMSSGGDVYAKWTRENITFTTQPTAVSKTYDGNAETLSVAVSNYGTKTYQWYKDSKAIDGATESTYKFTNVAASGQYYCVVGVSVDDTNMTQS